MVRRTILAWPCSLALAVAALAGPVAAQGPMSAIDWLSDSVTVATPVAIPAPPGGRSTEPAITTSATPQEVTTTTLGGATPDAAGLLPISVTGLPRELWGPTAATDLGRLIRAERADMVPALQALLTRLILAELEPPFDSDGSGALFLARIDKLLDLGALDQAAALIDRVGPASSAEIFRRDFDIALLLGTEDAACQVLADAPGLSPTYPARVFCQARNGDWDTAALTFGTAHALGYLDPVEEALLSRFLDPELFEGEPLPPTEGPVTPLEFRIFEAIGEPLPTGPLPRAFAQSDLRSTTGWKAQIEAAERLARTGAVEPTRLAAIWSERRAAASGGVWDRVSAFGELEEALATGDPETVEPALIAAWEVMRAAELEPVLAAIVSERVSALKLTGEAGRIAFQLALLTPDYEAAALARVPETPQERFLISVAKGQASGAPPPDHIAAAIAEGMAATRAPLRVQSLITEGRIGEAVLRAMDLVTLGATGELDELSDGIALLRALGLDGTARRAALEILILDRRG